MGVGRPPLSVGTMGKIRLYKVSTGYRARTLFRDPDGRTRGLERTGSGKGAATRALMEAVRDRVHLDGNAEITPDTAVKDLAHAWVTSLDSQSPTTIASYRNRVLAQIIPGLVPSPGPRTQRRNRGPVPPRGRHRQRHRGREDDPLRPVRDVRPGRTPRRVYGGCATALAQRDLAVAQLDGQLSVEDEEEFIGVVMGVPYEIALDLHNLDLAVVQPGHRLRRPVVSERRQLLGEVDRCIGHE